MQRGASARITFWCGSRQDPKAFMDHRRKWIVSNRRVSPRQSRWPASTMERRAQIERHWFDDDDEIERLNGRLSQAREPQGGFCRTCGAEAVPSQRRELRNRRDRVSRV